ncbi:MAG: hypothetical protein ACM31L_20470 [Actinomycetota bacterium]
MAITSLGAPPPGARDRLLADLQNSGLSADKAKLVQSDIESAVDQAKDASAGSRPDRASVRDAIDKKLTADVSAGKLTSQEADQVRQTLDQIDQRMAAGGPPPGGPPPGGAGGGGGGAGASQDSSSSKTEVSRTSTTSGNVTTIVITYSDGSKETKTVYGGAAAATSNASGADQLLAMLNDTSATDQTKARLAEYLKSLMGGNLLDIQA